MSTSETRPNARKTKDRSFRVDRFRDPRRKAFTLLELMLVLALLVTVSALVMPNIGRTLDSHRLRAAGEEVRTAWARARVRAMDSGRIYAFRHEISGNRYVIEPWLQQDDYLESSDLTMNGTAMGGPSSMSNEMNTTAAPLQEELPENISFVASESLADTRAMVASELGGSAFETDDQWSPPIFFYPDGTTSTARLQLTNVRNHALEVSIRGLTGVASVKEVFLQAR